MYALVVVQVSFSRMYSQRWIRSVGKSCTTSVDAYADTANQVAHSDGQSSPEQRVSGEDVGSSEDLLDVVNLVELRGEDDGHDDAVDGDDLAENDGDQVLRSYPRCLDTSTNDRNTGSPNSPVPMSELSCYADMRCHTMLSLQQTGRCTARCPN
jgi:hypothetical protein